MAGADSEGFVRLEVVDPDAAGRGAREVLLPLLNGLKRVVDPQLAQRAAERGTDKE